MAIVIHAARATRHWVPARVRRGDRMYHLFSDLLGRDGTRELVAFAARFGLRAEWIQYAGTYREHFDVREDMGQQMLAAGARLATNREVGHLLVAKREGEGSAG